MRKKVNKQKKYRRLSPCRGTLTARCRLWQAADHLLLVHETGCIEEYKRFYFQDIQALIIARSAGYLIGAIALPIPALALAATAAFAIPGSFLEWFSRGLYGFAGLLGIIWIIHLLLGPTCKCWIQTEINLEPLVMYNRTRQVERFRRKIKPLLAKAQVENSQNKTSAENPTERSE